VAIEPGHAHTREPDRAGTLAQRPVEQLARHTPDGRGVVDANLEAL
jgi:hypothetical protein